MPIVSVLMTSYNRENYICESIESVLSSSFSDFELIIVDDCSLDNTFEIASDYAQRDPRIKVFRNTVNLGDYPNRNIAASYAQGKYLKYLDSDDIIYPHGLRVMVDAMEQFPDAGFGLASISDFSDPFPIMLSSHDTYLEHFGKYGHFGRAPGSSIIQTKAFKFVNGFSGKRMIGDFELWFTLSRYYPMVKFPRDLVWDRVHEGQESQSDYAQNYNRLRKSVIRDALEHPDCPLNKDEIISALNSNKMEVLKKIIKRWI